MTTSGRRDPAQQSTPAGSPLGSAPAGAATPPGSASSTRRIVLLVAIVLVAIPFLIALWMLFTAAASALDTEGRGATLLLSAFTMLATGVVLLALIPWVFSKDVRMRAILIATAGYLLMSLVVGLTLSIASGAPAD